MNMGMVVHETSGYIKYALVDSSHPFEIRVQILAWREITERVNTLNTIKWIAKVKFRGILTFECG